MKYSKSKAKPLFFREGEPAPGDERLNCQECGKDFFYTAGEQLFFKSRNLPDPKRCYSCRKLRRALYGHNMKVNQKGGLIRC